MLAQTPRPKQERLHALDNLRAAMMWLGIVIHVVSNHLTGGFPEPRQWLDTATSPLADFLFLFIHAFRMPVFFIVAGFFVTLLILRDDYRGMLKHRLRRIGLPFMIFWPVIFIVNVILIMLFVGLMVHGSPQLDPDIMPPPSNGEFFNTMHLWFIYLLLWFCVLTAMAGSVLHLVPAPIKAMTARAMLLLASRWWGVVILTLIVASATAGYWGGVLRVGGSFLPPFVEWLYYGAFFVFGIYLYHHRTYLLALYMRWWALYAIVGGVFFTLTLILFRYAEALPQPDLVMALTYGASSWLWSMALIGGFLKLMPTQNKVFRYIAESSYWVYLIHMTFTIGFGIMLYELPLGAVQKMMINTAATTIVCLISYQLMVRRTFIGRLLNGKQVPSSKMVTADSTV